MATSAKRFAVSIFALVVLSITAENLSADDAVEAKKPVQQRSARLSRLSPTAIENLGDPQQILVLYLFAGSHLGTEINNSDLEHLQKFSKLKTLILWGDKLTDASLEHIVKLKTLEALVIYEGQFTNEGIQQLKEASTLETIGIYGTKVTRLGIKELQDQMPETYIELSWDRAYNENRGVFDRTGCLRADFYDRHIRFKPRQVDAVEEKSIVSFFLIMANDVIEWLSDD